VGTIWRFRLLWEQEDVGIVDGSTTDWYWRGAPNFENCAFYNQNTRGVSPITVTNLSETLENFVPSSGDATYDSGSVQNQTQFDRNKNVRGPIKTIGDLS